MSNMNKVLGFERINERRQRPNKLINFIKPREGPDKDLAQDFLERVAAICYPIMKANHLVVMSLEEFPSNKEFLGRNFNAGEIIQLVLKAPSGQWYPFKHVQMVMMHELAHCKQMNHSRDFWKVNNGFRDELKGLWGRGYCGEGLWGRGKMLVSGRFSNDSMPDAADGPFNLCGGTYRSKGGRKRKRAGDKPQLSWAEQKQRRIAKKFGVNGQALGADEYARFGLDQGRHRPSKPRVAGSKRGRELRAAAALARFDMPAQETTTPGISKLSATKNAVHEDIKQEDLKQEPLYELQYDSETDSDDEMPSLTGDWDDNNDVVRICENEDIEDDNARHELDELRKVDRMPDSGSSQQTDTPATQPHDKDHRKVAIDLADNDRPGSDQRIGSDASTDSENETDEARSSLPAPATTSLEPQESAPVTQKRLPIFITKAAPRTKTPLSASNDTTPQPPDPATSKASSTSNPIASASVSTITPDTPSTTTSLPTTTPSLPLPDHAPLPHHSLCPICAFANSPSNPTCTICAHVLDTAKIKNWWRCKAAACEGSEYRNSGDYGRCGICFCRREGG